MVREALSTIHLSQFIPGFKSATEAPAKIKFRTIIVFPLDTANISGVKPPFPLPPESEDGSCVLVLTLARTDIRNKTASKSSFKMAVCKKLRPRESKWSAAEGSS